MAAVMSGHDGDGTSLEGKTLANFLEKPGDSSTDVAETDEEEIESRPIQAPALVASGTSASSADTRASPVFRYSGRSPYPKRIYRSIPK